jgi:hypothetical protein
MIYSNIKQYEMLTKFRRELEGLDKPTLEKVYKTLSRKLIDQQGMKEFGYDLATQENAAIMAKQQLKKFEG